MKPILVVDDDPSVRALVTDILELEGDSVRTAVDGVAALAEIAAALPSAVVLDAMMPGLDGYAVLERLRVREDCRELPVIMLTAATDDASAWRAFTAGVDYFLAKPFQPAQLLHFFEYLFGDVEVL